MLNKRGLSNVVTIVLVILLALAAVGIIWAFIQPTINQAGESIDLGTECLRTEARVAGCSVSGNNVDLNVQLTRGNTALVEELIGVAEDADGVVNTGVKSGPIELLNTYAVTATFSSAPAAPVVGRASVKLSDGENELTCDVSVEAFDCT